MILIINNVKAVWKHLSGFQSFNATGKLSFEDNCKNNVKQWIIGVLNAR